jgi:membrane-associated protease RseP (regulator of RpoE activity)
MPTRFSSRWREYGVPALLLLLSVITTTAIGARFMQNFLAGLPILADDGDLWPWPWLFAQPSRFLLGIPFSASLLAILLAHEFGHYFACQAHKIRCTLPWVLPAPTLSGTLGAVIQIRGRIPGRRSLMDVGVYGPIAGYLVSMVVLALGFLLSRAAPHGYAQAQLVTFGQPLTLKLVHHALAGFHPGLSTFAQAIPHPVLIAGWIGLFITSLNLLPGGQLDGGHILYALAPRVHRVATWLLPVLLLVAGIFLWVGWILWAAILCIPALRHPRVPADQPLNGQRIWLSVAALAIFVLSFSANPFAGNSLLHFINRMK